MTKSRCLGFSFETLVASMQSKLKYPYNLPHLENRGALRIMSGRNICSRALPRCSRECQATAVSCLLRMSILLRSRRPQTTTKGRIQRIAGESASMRAHIAEIRMFSLACGRHTARRKGRAAPKHHIIAASRLPESTFIRVHIYMSWAHSTVHGTLRSA